MALIAHRFHSIEAEGPWTSPPFPPAERRHIVQGVIAGYIMGRPRWAEDLDGNFIYGLDAKGKELKSAPSTRTTTSRRHATKKKSPAQLQREIDEVLASPGSFSYEEAMDALEKKHAGVIRGGSLRSGHAPVVPKMKTSITKAPRSAGHLAWLDGGTKEAYEQGGEVYIAPTSYPIDTEGHRQGARWESSLSHWKRHYDEIWKPRVSGSQTKARRSHAAKKQDPVKCTFTASIRLSGAPAAMQMRAFKHRADAQAWLDQQREIADRRGWSGYRFELTEQCEIKRKGR